MYLDDEPQAYNVLKFIKASIVISFLFYLFIDVVIGAILTHFGDENQQLIFDLFK